MKKYIRQLNLFQGDKYIWLIVIALSLFSLLAVYSSTGTLAYKTQGGNTEYFLIKHLFLIFFGLALMWCAHLVNYKYFSRISQILLLISVPLLIYTLFFGADINNAKRWITLPIIKLTFQTSDLAKLALIMYTARVLSKKQSNIKSFKEAFVPIIAPILVICGLIAPADLSSAAVLFVTCLAILFIGRVNLGYIGLMIGGGVAALGLVILITLAMPGKGRVDTWKNRITSFQNQELSEKPYQVQQSLIAISRGGLTGRGPGNSLQRNFLPHPYSDFIYAIVIEEYGILGGFVIVALYLAFLFRCTKIVIKAPKAYGALLAVGLAIMLVFQALMNMAVVVNLVPVTGLVLPFISMGGTSLLFTSISVGIILAVSRDIEIREKALVKNMNNAELENAA